MKIKPNAIISLLLICSLLLFSACGSDGSSSAGESAAADAPESSLAAAESESQSAAGDSVILDGEVAELRMVFPGQNSSPASLAEVEAQMNEQIAGKVDAKVKLEIVEWGVYNDQTNLMLSSGEDVAIMFYFNNIRAAAESGKIQPITGYLDTYGKDALAVFERYLDACRIDGEFFGLPSFFDYAANAGLVCRTDLLEELAVDPGTVKSFDDIEQVLAKLKEAYPAMDALIVPDSGAVFPYYNHGKFDEIASNSGMSVYIDKPDDIKVVNYYATPEYRELAEKAYDWNQKGYFISDATTITNARQEYIAAGNAFGYIGKIHPGTVTQETKNSGFQMSTMPVTGAFLNTGNVNFAQYTVPTGCKYPEKAVAFLNEFYTNPVMQNLMAYGVEGKDYIMKDEATQVVGYPEGVDETNVGWVNETWVCGNGAISYVWETDPVTIWEDYLNLNESATISPIYGFVYDMSNVKNEIAAVGNVIDKYKGIVESGYAEVDESLTAFNSELEAAGIQKMIDDAQAQVDAWVSAR